MQSDNFLSARGQKIVPECVPSTGATAAAWRLTRGLGNAVSSVNSHREPNNGPATKSRHHSRYPCRTGDARPRSPSRESRAGGVLPRPTHRTRGACRAPLPGAEAATTPKRVRSQCERPCRESPALAAQVSGTAPQVSREGVRNRDTGESGITREMTSIPAVPPQDLSRSCTRRSTSPAAEEARS